MPLSCLFSGPGLLAGGDDTAPAAELQRILDQPTPILNQPHGALAHLGLAELTLRRGNTDRHAPTTTISSPSWKDPDLDISIYKQAKAESAKLQ